MSSAPASIIETDNVVYMSPQLSAIIEPVVPAKKPTLIEESFNAGYRVAFRLLGHREASQDIAIEAVARLIEKNLQEETFAPSYCARAAARLVISSWRKDATARKYAHMIAPVDDHMADTSYAELRVDLRRALGKLTKRQRDIVALRYLADVSESNVADFLQISVGTVKSTTHDALARLKKMVEVMP
jgi:RNA polymerase sigma factor (sigma-70 family)